MPSASFDWKSLAEMGVATIVVGLQGQSVRDVDCGLITATFAEALKAVGLDPGRPMTVRWQTPPPNQDVYIFEQGEA